MSRPSCIHLAALVLAPLAAGQAVTERVSTTSGGDQCDGPAGTDIHRAVAVDGTGRCVAFVSASTDLVPGQSLWDQFWSRDTGFAPPDASNQTDGIEQTVAS